MTFWSGEKWKTKGCGDAVVTPFKPERVDCAAYTLSLGSRAFVTQAREERTRRSVGFEDLTAVASSGTVLIPPGQFAYLTTAESVRVPPDCLGLISVKAKVKLKGLVNISGFHVDPGWDGHLIFSVFNAGAEKLALRRDDPLFLIFLAALDRSSDELYSGNSSYGRIPTGMIESALGGVQSTHSIADQLLALNKKVDRFLLGVKVVAGTVAFIGVLSAIGFGLHGLSSPRQSTASSLQSPPNYESSSIGENGDNSPKCLPPPHIDQKGCEDEPTAIEEPAS